MDFTSHLTPAHRSLSSKLYGDRSYIFVVYDRPTAPRCSPIRKSLNATPQRPSHALLRPICVHIDLWFSKSHVRKQVSFE